MFFIFYFSFHSWLLWVISHFDVELLFVLFFCFPPSLLVLTPFPFLCLTLFGALGNSDYICFSFLGCSSAGAISDVRGRGTSALSNPGEMHQGGLGTLWIK